MTSPPRPGLAIPPQSRGGGPVPSSVGLVAATKAATAEDARHTAEPVRMQVAQRLGLVGRRHLRYAGDQRWAGHPIAAHAIFFLYMDPPANTIGEGLHVATRLFLAGPEVADLPTILATLRGLADEYAAGPVGFEPRVQLCTHVEEMNYGAAYIGVGTSTLLPQHARVAPTPAGVDADIPFEVRAILTDETQLTVTSAGGVLDPLDIRSTHTLNTTRNTVAVTWNWAAPRRATEERTKVIWSALADLHEFVLDNAPQGFYTARRRGRRRRLGPRRRRSDNQ